VKEFALLWTLAREPGVVKTRNALLDAAYGDGDEVGMGGQEGLRLPCLAGSVLHFQAHVG